MNSSEQNLYGWGSNQSYLFSKSGRNKKYTIPKNLKLQIIIESMACTQKNVVILAKNGEVYRFENQSLNKISGLENIIKLANGIDHILALDMYGKVFSWGTGKYGSLGNQNFQSSESPQPVLISQRIIDIYCGKHTSFFITNSNQVYACGSNRFGQLGVKLLKNYFNPVKIQLGNIKIKQIAGGDQHTLYLTNQGEIYAAGNGKNGRLGTKNSIDLNNKLQKVNTKQKFKKIAASNYSAAINQNGIIYVWGTSLFGFYKQPTIFTKKKKFEKLIIKKDSGFAISNEDQVWVWGKNQFGELGLGDTQQRAKPHQLTILQNHGTDLFIGPNYVFCVSNTLIKMNKKQNKENNENIEHIEHIEHNKHNATKSQLSSPQKYSKLKKGKQIESKFLQSLKSGLTSRTHKISLVQDNYDNKLLLTERYLESQKSKIQRMLEIHTKQRTQYQQLKQSNQILLQQNKKLNKIIKQKDLILVDVKKKVTYLEEMMLQKLKIDHENLNRKVQNQVIEHQKKCLIELQNLNSEKKRYENQKNEIKQDNRKIKEQLQKNEQNFKKILSNKEIQILKFQEMINQKTKRIIQLQDKLNLKQNQVQKLKQNQQKKKVKIEQLNNDLGKLQNHIQTLSKKLQSKQNQLITVYKKIQKNNQLSEQSKKYENKLKSQFINFNQQTQRYLKNDREKTIELDKLNKKINQLEISLSDYKFQEIRYTNQIEKLQNQLKEKFDSCQDKQSQLVYKISELNSDLKKYKQNQEINIKEIRQLNKKNGNLESIVNQMKIKQEMANYQLNNNITKLKHLDQQYQNLKNLYEKSTKLNAKNQKQIIEISKKIQYYQDHQSQLKIQKYSQDLELNGMNKIILQKNIVDTKNREQKQFYQKQLAKLKIIEQENKKYAQQNLELRKNYEKIIEKLETIKNQNQKIIKIQYKNEQSKGEFFKELVTQNISLDSQLKQYQKRQERLKIQINQNKYIMKNQIQKYQQEIKKLSEMNKKLQQQINLLTKNLDINIQILKKQVQEKELIKKSNQQYRTDKNKQFQTFELQIKNLKEINSNLSTQIKKYETINQQLRRKTSYHLQAQSQIKQLQQEAQTIEYQSRYRKCTKQKIDKALSKIESNKKKINNTASKVLSLLDATTL